jgi:hypothetical protein
MAFWGIVVKGNSSRKETVIEEANLVVTQACLDPSGNEASVLSVETEGVEKIRICSLQATRKRRIGTGETRSDLRGWA